MKSETPFFQSGKSPCHPLSPGLIPYSASGETPTNLGKLLVEFGKSIGIDSRRSRGYIADLLVKTEGFREEALAVLESLPKAHRRYRAPDLDGFSKMLGEVRLVIETSFAKTRG